MNEPSSLFLRTCSRPLRHDGWTVEKEHDFHRGACETRVALAHAGSGLLLGFAARHCDIREHSTPVGARARRTVNIVNFRGFATPRLMRRADQRMLKGLRQFLDAEQQQAWLEGEAELPDTDERSEFLEHRFKYLARAEKLLQRPQARDVLDILRVYGETCIPIPRTTERYYWSVSCLPSTSDKPLVRVNASWMELFTLLPEGNGLRSRIIVHLSDFTTDGSPDPAHLDQAFLESCVERPEDVAHALWRSKDILIVKVRGSASIRKFLATPRALRAIRRFNLTHMNRGRNAYQASHCYSVADCMLGEA
jgi:hypothetical protein